MDDLGGGVTSLPDLAATSGFTIGSRYGKTETLNGSMGEVLIYNAVLSDSDRDKVWQYLANKWKLYHPSATWIAAGNYDTPKTVAIHSGKLNQQQVTTNHSPLVMWLDAQDSSRFFTNTGCTTAAVPGNTIACWDDKSPSNNDAIQATGGSQLTYVSAGINNKNSLNSTVNGQTMTVTNNASLNPTNYTMFVVANFTSDSENWPGLLYKTSNYSSMADGYGARFGLNGGNYIQYVGQGGAVTPRINGVGSPSTSATINTPYIITLNNATPWTATAVDLKIGKDGPGYNIGEVLLFGTTLTTAQIQEIEGYLASRWGMSL